MSSPSEKEETPAAATAPADENKAKKVFDSIVGKTKEAAETIKQKGKEFDEKHGKNIKEKTKQATSGLVEKTKAFEEKHQIANKAGKGMKQVSDFVSDKFKKLQKPKDDKPSSEK